MSENIMYPGIDYDAIRNSLSDGYVDYKLFPFNDDYIGFAARNMELLFWCGYLGIPEKHPWVTAIRASDDERDKFEKIPSELQEATHFEITWCEEYLPVHDDCLKDIPQGTPHKMESLVWFGFDCSHSTDYTPVMEERMNLIYARRGEKRNLCDCSGRRSYRSIQFVYETLKNMKYAAVMSQSKTPND